jgi:hypothetical protein
MGFSQLFGGDGDDDLILNIGDGGVSPGAGHDTISGSSRENDFSEVTYFFDARSAGASSGISVVFDAEGSGTITDYAGDTDTFTNIDAIRGTQLADNFTGSDGKDRFSGVDGNDTFDGGAGRDEVDYWWSQFADGTSGVTVDLAAGTATDPYGDTDTLISIEQVRGSDFADQINRVFSAQRTPGREWGRHTRGWCWGRLPARRRWRRHSYLRGRCVELHTRDLRK